MLALMIARGKGKIKTFGRSAAALRLVGRSQPLPVVSTVGIVGGQVVIALWLWMAQVNSQGRSWARILSTVLSGLATLTLTGVLSEPGTAPGLHEVKPFRQPARPADEG
jgi:hypothetical protein